MPKASIHERAEYLSDAIVAASDGLVTTFAIVAGAAGATLSQNVVLILGFANLFADGFSMASGKYLGVKSEIEYEKKEGSDAKEGPPITHAIMTFLFFDIAGIIPLLPFLFRVENPFVLSTFLVGVSFFVVGFLRSFFTGKNLIKSAVEMFTIGGLASFVAFGIGFLIDKYII